jgi:short-subunit dehydrogenase
MQKNFTKKTALITGASSGIGRDLATIFAREGFDLIITARREKRLEEIKGELERDYNCMVAIYPCDLAESDAPDKIYDFVNNLHVKINVLVNNAGIGDFGFFKNSDWDKNAAMLNLNITSLTHLTHLFLPDLMSHEKSYIMNVASTAAFQPGPLMSVYYATKHYVLAFSEAIANELSDSGVIVSALCPGPTASEFQDVSNMDKSKLFELFPVADSADVAEFGYTALMKEKRVAVYGLLNKIGAKTTALLPGKWVTSVVRFIMEKK